MSWGDELTEQERKFREVVLPPGFLDRPGEQVLGTTPREPEVEPAAEAPRRSRQVSGPAAGREVARQHLRPRHRNVVRRYFDAPEPALDEP